MERIGDNYKWKKMEHWKYVVDKKYVEWKDITEEKINEKQLHQAIQLLLRDCFPIAIICCIEGKKKKIIGTSIWKSIFSFINNECKIEWNGVLISFDDMDEEEKRKLMEAQIFSVWIDINAK